MEWWKNKQGKVTKIINQDLTYKEIYEFLRCKLKIFCIAAVSKSCPISRIVVFHFPTRDRLVGLFWHTENKNLSLRKYQKSKYIFILEYHHSHMIWFYYICMTCINQSVFNTLYIISNLLRKSTSSLIFILLSTNSLYGWQLHAGHPSASLVN